MKQQLQSYGARRFLSLCLAFVMWFSCFPLNTYATQTDDVGTEVTPGILESPASEPLEESVLEQEADHMEETTSAIAAVQEKKQENNEKETQSYTTQVRSGSTGDGSINLSQYSDALRIYNSTYYTSPTGAIIVNAQSGYSLAGTAAVPVFVGDQPMDGNDDTNASNQDISLTLKGLVMDPGKDLNILPVYNGERWTMITAQSLKITEEETHRSSVHTMNVAKNAKLKLTLEGDMSVTSLILGAGSTLEIETQGYTLTAGEILGADANVIISGSGTVECPEIQTKDLTVTGTALNAKGGSVIATGNIRVTNAAISNAAFFGYNGTAEGTKEITFSGIVTCNAVTLMGTTKDANAIVKIIGINTLTGSVTELVCDYALTYQNSDGTALSNPLWPTNYRVCYSGLGGSVSVLGSTADGKYTKGNVTLPEHAISGHGYVGWKLTDDSAPIVALSNQSGDLTLKLTMAAGTVAVSWDLMYNPDVNSNDEPLPNRTWTDSKRLGDTLYLSSPFRFGYRFAGWKITTGTTNGVYSSASYTIKLQDLTSTGAANAYELKLEAQWVPAEFPVNLNLAIVPKENIELSTDGKTWLPPAEFAAQRNLTWDATSSTLSLKGMTYDEPLGDFLARAIGVNLELRDTRQAPDQQRFYAWTTLTGEVMQSSDKYCIGSKLLGERPAEKTLMQWQEDLQLKPVNLSSAWTTMAYHLIVDLPDGWEVLVDGNVEEIPEGKVKISSGSLVSLRSAVDNSNHISYWTFYSLATDGKPIYILPTERAYSAGDQYLYYDFVMPAKDVTAENSYASTDPVYVDLAKSPITFAENVPYNNRKLNGFWYGEKIGRMTPVFYDAEEEAYFYRWETSKAFYVTSNNVATDNQLTIINAMTGGVYFKDCNLVATEGYRQAAKDRKLNGILMEYAGSGMPNGLDGTDCSSYGNVILDNSVHKKYDTRLYMQGKNNVITAIFPSKMYKSEEYCGKLYIYGEGLSTSCATFGSVNYTGKLSISNLSIEGVNDEYAYLLYTATAAYMEDGMDLSNCKIDAPHKRLYVGYEYIDITNCNVDVHSIFAAYTLRVYQSSYVRVRNEVVAGIHLLDIYDAASLVVDGGMFSLNLLASYGESNITTSGYVIVKGMGFVGTTLNKSGSGIMLSNMITCNKKHSISAGTIVTNQLMNVPVSKPALDTDGYFTVTAYSSTQADTSKNGDNLPFYTYCNTADTKHTYSIRGGATYLLGYYHGQPGSYDVNHDYYNDENNPVSDIIKTLIDEKGDLKSDRPNAADIQSMAVSVITSEEENPSTIQECVLLGSTLHTADTAYAKSVSISGGKLFARGNVTYFNDTTVSGGTVFCTGTFGSKRDLTISNGTVTATEIGIAYNIINNEAGLERYNKLSLIGGTVTTDRLGTLSTPINGVTPRGVLHLGTGATISYATGNIEVYNDLRANYLYDEDIYSVVEGNPESLNFYGIIAAGTNLSLQGVLQLTAPVKLITPKVGEESAMWLYDSPGGEMISSVGIDGYVNADSKKEIVYQARDSFAVYAAKGSYSLNVDGDYNGGFTVNGGQNILLQNGSTEATVGNKITITLDDNEKLDRTVVWYTDAAGVVHNALTNADAMDREAKTITFNMPYADTTIWITSELSLYLDLYHVSFLKDGFALEEPSASRRMDSEFFYRGNLLITQVDTAEHYNRMAFETAESGNVNGEGKQIRTITLKKLTQRSLGILNGTTIANNAKVVLTVDGINSIAPVKLPQSASIVLKGKNADREKDHLRFATYSGLHSYRAVGDSTAGSITFEDLKLDAVTNYARMAYSANLTDQPVVFRNCYIDYSSNYYTYDTVSHNMHSVTFESCYVIITGSKDVSNSIALGCGSVSMIETTVDYKYGGKRNGFHPFYSNTTTQPVLMHNSVLNLTMWHSETASTVYFETGGTYGCVTMTGNSQINASHRLKMMSLDLRDNSSVTVQNGDLFCPDLTIQDQATVTADYVHISGFNKDGVADELAFQTSMANGKALNGNSYNGLTMTGGTLNANEFVGGDVNAKLNISGGLINAKRIGTYGALFGSAIIIPTYTSDDHVYQYNKVPDAGTVVSINGGEVRVAESGYLGGMRAEVNISGGKIILADNAILGLTEEHKTELYNYVSSKGQQLMDAVKVTISGGMVEGAGDIHTPYSTLSISGSNTAIHVADLSARNGTIEIQEVATTYTNPYDGTDNEHPKVGIVVTNRLEAQILKLYNGAVVFANQAFTHAEAGKTGMLSLKDQSALYTTSAYGTTGEGNSEIEVEEGSKIFGNKPNYIIQYVLNDDALDRAVNSDKNRTSFQVGDNNGSIDLHDPTRYGFDFDGWYADEKLTEPIVAVTTNAHRNHTIYAKWVPKQVTFQIQVSSEVIATLENEIDSAKGTLKDGIFTYTKEVKVNYRDSIYGAEAGHINLLDYRLASYDLIALALPDNTELATNAVVTAAILNAAYENDGVLVLTTLRASKFSRRVTLDLNLDQKERPVDAIFCLPAGINPDNKTDTTITSPVEVQKPVTSGQGFSDNGKLVQAMAPGYTFAGWYNEPVGGTKLEDEYVISNQSDAYFYAHWIPNTYQIAFDAGEQGIITLVEEAPNSHEGSRNLIGTAVYDAVLNGGLTFDGQSGQNLPYAWKQGYVFLGWSTKANPDSNAPLIDKEELNTTQFPVMKTEIAKNDEAVLTLYAVYRAVTITYDLNGGVWCNDFVPGKDGLTKVEGVYGYALAGYTKTADTDYRIEYTEADDFAESKTYVPNDYRHALMNKGYTFTGWYSDGEEIKSVPAYSDISVTAEWKANTYTLKLYPRNPDKTDYISAFHYGESYGENGITIPNVVVGQEITAEAFPTWPGRGGEDPWYAYDKPDEGAPAIQEGDKRFLLGFTFDSLDPGDTRQEKAAGYKKYLEYAAAVTRLLNNDALFMKSENLTPGSIFHLPQDSQYSGTIIKETHEVVDYPSGSEITMYAVYREISLVFVEYVRLANGMADETVLASFPWSEWNDYPFAKDGYAATNREKDWHNQGYALVGWYVNSRDLGAQQEPYPRTAADYQTKVTDYRQKASDLGTYDITVYAVYAPQVSVKNVVLTANTDPAAANPVTYLYTLPGSMQEGTMNYELVDLQGLTLVGKDQLNAYDSDKANTTVALEVTLLDQNGDEKESKYLTASSGKLFDFAVAPGWKIRLTLHHSNVMSENQTYEFDLKLGYQEETLKQQYILMKDMQIVLAPSVWEVTYVADLPENPVVTDWEGFDANSMTQVLQVPYGGSLLDEVPRVTGYTANGNWVYKADKTLGYGESLKLAVTAENRGKIQLTTEWNVNSYALSATQRVLEDWKVTYGTAVLNNSVDIPYRTIVAITPKQGEENYPEYVWLKLGQGDNAPLVRLDQYEFATANKDGTYTFPMPASGVAISYNDVMVLYLEKGSIDLAAEGFLQEEVYGQTRVTWRGNYVIWMDAQNNSDNSVTANTLSLSGDLSKRLISLGNLNVEAEDAISLAHGTSAYLKTDDSVITVKNVYVPENASLTISNGTWNLAPGSNVAAIGGRTGAEAKNGIIILNGVTANLQLGYSNASGIGPGNQSCGGGAVQLNDCTITVTESSSAAGVFSGAWVGGYQVSSVILSNTHLTIGESEISTQPYVLDGKAVGVVNGSWIGTEENPVPYQIRAQSSLKITDSHIYQNMNQRGWYAIGAYDGAVEGTIEVKNSVISSRIAYPGEGYYRGVLNIQDPVSDVVIANVQILENAHGSVTIHEDKAKQGEQVHTHSGSYLLINELGGTKPDVTVKNMTPGQTLSIKNANIQSLRIECDVTMKPVGKVTIAGAVTIGDDKTLRVEQGEQDELELVNGFTGTTTGNYSHSGGKLVGLEHLKVGGDMELINVTVSAAEKNVGSLGLKPVTRVVLNNANVMVGTVGALGPQNSTFTFVEESNGSTVNGTLVRDWYRLAYELNDPNYPKDASGVPYDAAVTNSNVSLPTVLRSSTVCGAESRQETFTPSIPSDPKPSEGVDSYFGAWYMTDAKGVHYALSLEQVEGFANCVASLTSEHMALAEEAETEGSPRTLKLRAWMDIQGTAVIAAGRNLNEISSSDTSVSVPVDGAWTVKFTVTGAAPAESDFKLVGNFPANTKLTLRVEHQNTIGFYYYECEADKSEVSLKDFIKMGSGNEKLNLIGDSGIELDHSLQIAADFSNADVPQIQEAVVQLQMELSETRIQVAKATYSLTAAPLALLTITGDQINISWSGDGRMDNRDLYLVAKVSPGAESYSADVFFNGNQGSKLSGNCWFWRLDSAESEVIISGVWRAAGFPAGKHTIQWTLTSAPASDWNVRNNVLDIGTSTFEAAEKADPAYMAVQVQLVDGAASGGRVLTSDTAHTVVFSVDTNISTFTASAERQTAFFNFSATNDVQCTVVDGTVAAVFRAGVKGTYRLRFSCNANTVTDDVYMTFVLE